jgi:L-lactate dehydrogenase complex protein LldE
MRVGLFIPCYVDQFYPQVGVATLQLLERLGCEVVYPPDQTCCGQPMANSGFEHLTAGCNDLFIRNFSEFDYIVSPSGSCVLHIREHLHAPGAGHTPAKHTPAATPIPSKIFELVEFLTDILHVETLDAAFPFKVGLHQSCHGQRGLGLAQMSELMAPPFSKPQRLLTMVKGIQLIGLDRVDECCGFGGTFCVTEPAISVKMGKDRIADHLAHGAEVITGSDMSCLMHLEGILRRGKSTIRVKHIAEILNSQ